ncbi:unnamed protein product [Urochloa decumbens]|uniref:Histone-lysine N-methyltransferase SUVR4 n=1 Tax=Urochloa decumbens TaxID=240449 RepID=A0ABC9G0P1_9POAL
MVSNKERARRAIDAMTALGFSKKETTPVLKSLLKLFEQNWEPIEDECYRALANAILDARDRPKGPEHDSHRARMVAPEEDHHQPSTSLVVHGGPCDLDSETEAPRIKRPRTNSNIFSADHSIDPQLFPSSSTAAKERAKQMIDEEFQHAVFLREPKPEPDVDVAQSFQDAQVGVISHPFNTCSSGAAGPLALCPPNQNQTEISGNKGIPVQHCRTRTSSPSFVERKDSMGKQPQNRGSLSNHTAVMHNTETGSADECTEAPYLHTVVASSSSTMGDVEMSIKCNIDPSKFRMPSLETIFRMVEDKCLRSYKNLPPNFSVGSMINEICQCVAQLANDRTAEYTVQSDSFDNCRNSEKESVLVKPIACVNSGGVKNKSVEDPFILETSENGQEYPNVAQRLALSQVRSTHDAPDISKGEEKVRISVVNEFSSEKCPPSFYYIQRNTVSPKAYDNISAGRIGDEDGCAGCFGNCLSAPIPCACATGGEFAYTPEGLVRTEFLEKCFSVNLFPEKHHKFFCKPLERPRNEASPEPCRGHLIRKVIKECWSKCGCNMQCGNRVVQHGITCNLQVFFTQEGKGWGLRTLDELPKGAFVCEYVGELLTNTELRERTSKKTHKVGYTYPVDLDAACDSEGVLKDEEALCLDATFYGNVGRFINHRCYDANLVGIPVEVETPLHHYCHLALFTRKKIEAFEELTWDYGIDFDDDKHPGKPFQCLCGSRYCRGRRRHRNRGKAAAKQAVVEETRG